MSTYEYHSFMNADIYWTQDTELNIYIYFYDKVYNFVF